MLLLVAAVLAVQEVAEFEMLDRNVGLKLYDEAGSLVVELGGFVLLEHPEFARQIGVLASEWAHAEAELSAYLAALMRTSPERTFALLAAYRNADSTATAALNLAEVTLHGDMLAEFKAVAARFRKLAKERNEVQHGLWARKPAYDGVIFRVKALEYTKLMVRIVQSDDMIAVAETFSASLNDSYSLDRLEALTRDVRQLTSDVCSGRLAWQKNCLIAEALKGAS